MHRSKLELKKGSILRKELLEDLYHYPRIAVETYYSCYSDGILYGLKWECSKEREGHHIITPGALKYHGEIYFLSEQIDVEELLGDQIRTDQYYRLCFVEQEPFKKVETQTVYELKLQAVQSAEYNNIKDRSFYYARVNCMNNRLETLYENEVYGLYAGDDGYGFRLPDWILNRKIRSRIENKSNKHPLDYMILKEIYAQKGLSVSMAVLYLRECGVWMDEAEHLSPETLVDQLGRAIGLLRLEAAVKQCEETLGEEDPSDTMGGGLLI